MNIIKKVINLLRPVDKDVSVDYSKSIEEMAARLHFLLNSGAVGPPITSVLFPTDIAKRTIRIKARLTCLNRPLTRREAIEELESVGYRPGDIFEFLAFMLDRRNRQTNFAAIVLGSLVMVGDRLMNIVVNCCEIDEEISGYFGHRGKAQGSIYLDDFDDHRPSAEYMLYFAVRQSKKE